MPMSDTVNLPKKQKPLFPDRCVMCRSDHPETTFRVISHAIGWWTVVFLFWGLPFSIKAPACESCRRKMRRQFWVRMAVNLVFIAIGAFVAVTLLQGNHSPFRRWMGVGIALVCLIPVIYWEVLWPPPIDILVYGKTVDYEFKDGRYAQEFAELNQSKVT